MLHCNMNDVSISIRLSLDDLIGELQHARREGDLGRLALLAYCEVRRWARQAGEADLAERSSELITRNPHTTRVEFLGMVNELIVDLEQARRKLLAVAAQ
jgi:hypothetical protein